MDATETDRPARRTGGRNGPPPASRGISKTLRRRPGALTDVDLGVDPGEVVALVGDNGAGKSTLVKAIAGVNPPDEGVDRVGGQRRSGSASPPTRRDLGIATVYQDLALCDNLDVVGNLFLGREDQPIRRPRRDRDGEALEDCSTTLSVRDPERPHQPSASLSGGQRQIVAIARSLLGEPKVVLLDEPTAALGVAQTAQVLDLVERLRDRGLGVLLISHNMADVMAVADRVVVLRLGRNNGFFTGRRDRPSRRSSPRSPVPATTP